MILLLKYLHLHSQYNIPFPAESNEQDQVHCPAPMENVFQVLNNFHQFLSRLDQHKCPVDVLHW